MAWLLFLAFVHSIVLCAIRVVLGSILFWKHMHNKDCCKTQHSTTKQNTARQHDTTQHNTTRLDTRHNAIQYNTTQHNSTQHKNTTQHNTTQHNTAQHNTTQHNTIQHNTTILAFYIGLSSIKSHEKAREKKKCADFPRTGTKPFQEIVLKISNFQNLVQ